MTIRPLQLRQRLGPDTFRPPVGTSVGQGWTFTSYDANTTVLVFDVTVDMGSGEGDVEWLSAQVAHPNADPTLAELEQVKQAVFGEDGWVYMSLPPSGDDRNRSDHTARLWGRADGGPVLPRY